MAAVVVVVIVLAVGLGYFLIVATRPVTQENMPPETSPENQPPSPSPTATPPGPSPTPSPTWTPPPSENQSPQPPGLPHRVLGAISTDEGGLVWVKDNLMVSDRASVPDAVFDGENIRVYFAKWGIRVAISSDGVNWEEAEVSISGLPDGMGAVDPDVVLLPDGTYRLYYYENPMEEGDPAMIPGPHSIRVAVSDDGINFHRDREVYAQEWITDPDVVQMGDVWRMFVSSGGRTISTVSYDNGLSFTFERELQIGGAITSTVPVPGGYRMYYHAPETPPRIYSAFSADGANWVKDLGVRVEAGAPGSLDESGAESATVIRMPDGSYQMYYVSRYG